MTAFIVITILLGQLLAASAFDAEHFLNTADIYYERPLEWGGPQEVTMGDVEELHSQAGIVVVVHGYIAHRNHIAILPLKNAYLDQGRLNLFMADWADGAYLDYITSRNLVGPAGEHFAKILEEFMTKHHIDSKDVHLVGHSLGAHIVGNMGRYFNGTLGRVTGLDPALPLFFPHSSDSLQPDDAQFVDILHTDIPLAGDPTPRGQVDFYANCGRVLQPGCVITDLLLLSACSHFRAPKYYAESILAGKNFPAVPCALGDILNPLESSCADGNDLNSTVAFMGEEVSTSATGLFCFETNKVAPYGMGENSIAGKNN